MSQARPTTDRTRVHFSASQRVRAPREAIFPLLCPVREHDWIPTWSCEMVYTASGLAEEGCIFRTDRPADGGSDTWVVSRFEAPARIAFVRVNPLRAIQYDIRLDEGEGEATRLTWEQTITALVEAGDAHVAALREEDFTAMVARLERLLEHYLATGRALEG